MTINMKKKKLRKSAKRITANLPVDLLEEALEATGEGITDTLIQGLELVRRSRAYEQGMRIKGTMDLDLDLDTLRERP